MKVTWQVSDGYVGNRPHHLTIPDDELEGLDDAGRDEVIDSYVQGDFEQKISYSWEINP